MTLNDCRGPRLGEGSGQTFVRGSHPYLYFHGFTSEGDISHYLWFNRQIHVSFTNKTGRVGCRELFMGQSCLKRSASF